MRQVTLSDLNVRLSEDKTHVLIELDNTQLKVTLEEAVNVANIIEMTSGLASMRIWIMSWEMTGVLEVDAPGESRNLICEV